MSERDDAQYLLVFGKWIRGLPLTRREQRILDKRWDAKTGSYRLPPSVDPTVKP